MKMLTFVIGLFLFLFFIISNQARGLIVERMETIGKIHAISISGLGSGGPIYYLVEIMMSDGRITKQKMRTNANIMVGDMLELVEQKYKNGSSKFVLK